MKKYVADGTIVFRRENYSERQSCTDYEISDLLGSGDDCINHNDSWRVVSDEGSGGFFYELSEFMLNKKDEELLQRAISDGTIKDVWVYNSMEYTADGTTLFEWTSFSSRQDVTRQEIAELLDTDFFGTKENSSYQIFSEGTALEGFCTTYQFRLTKEDEAILTGAISRKGIKNVRIVDSVEGEVTSVKERIRFYLPSPDLKMTITFLEKLSKEGADFPMSLDLGYLDSNKTHKYVFHTSNQFENFIDGMNLAGELTND